MIGKGLNETEASFRPFFNIDSKCLRMIELALTILSLWKGRMAAEKEFVIEIPAGIRLAAICGPIV